MQLTEKIDFLMKEKGINKSELSRQSGIPYMTIINFYEKGTENVKLSTLKKLAKYFNVSLDYLANDEITTFREKAPDKLSEARRVIPDRLAENYYELDEPNRDQLVKYSDVLVSAYRYSKKEKPVVYSYEMDVVSEGDKERYDLIASAPGHESVRIKDVLPHMTLAMKMAQEFDLKGVKLEDIPEEIGKFKIRHYRTKAPENTYAAKGGGFIPLNMTPEEMDRFAQELEKYSNKHRE